MAANTSNTQPSTPITLEEEEEEEEEAPSEAFGYLNNELFRNLMFQG